MIESLKVDMIICIVLYFVYNFDFMMVDNGYRQYQTNVVKKYLYLTTCIIVYM